MSILSVALFVLVGIYSAGVLWLFYLASINLINNRDEVTLPAKVIGYPLVLIGVVLDAAFNIVFGSAIFLEPPELSRILFTARCEKFLKSNNWRGKVARFFCRHFMDPFDKDNKHCKAD